MGPWGRSLVSLVVGLLLAELTLRAAWWVPSVRAALDHRYGAASEQLAVFYKVDAGRESERFVVDPELGWVERAGQHPVGVATATISELGAREPSPSGQERAPGRFRVLLLGDSFTLGDDVGDEEAWGARLRHHAPGVEVVNLGVGGYDVGQAWLRYRRDGVAWQPDVVILGMNDLMTLRSVLPFTSWARPIIRSEAGRWEPEGTPVPGRTEVWWETLLTPRLWYAAEMVRYASADRAKRTALADMRAARTATRLVEDVERSGAVPLVVYLPPLHAVQEKLDGEKPAPCLGWPRGAGALELDLLGALVDLAEQGVSLQQGTHWTPAVHDRVAWEVATSLRGWEVLPPDAPPG